MPRIDSTMWIRIVYCVGLIAFTAASARSVSADRSRIFAEETLQVPSTDAGVARDVPRVKMIGTTELEFRRDTRGSTTDGQDQQNELIDELDFEGSTFPPVGWDIDDQITLTFGDSAIDAWSRQTCQVDGVAGGEAAAWSAGGGVNGPNLSPCTSVGKPLGTRLFRDGIDTRRYPYGVLVDLSVWLDLPVLGESSRAMKVCWRETGSNQAQCSSVVVNDAGLLRRWLGLSAPIVFSDAANKPSIEVMFWFDDDTGAGSYQGAFLDNVRIEGVISAPTPSPTSVISPTPSRTPTRSSTPRPSSTSISVRSATPSSAQRRVYLPFMLNQPSGSPQTEVSSHVEPVVADAYVASGRDWAAQSRGTREGLYLGFDPRESSQFQERQEVLVRFDLGHLAGQVRGAQYRVTNARLRLYQVWAGAESEEIPALQTEVHLLQSAWAERAVSWNSKPGTSALVSSGSILPRDNDWVDLPIPSTVVEMWLADPSRNFGALLRSPTEAVNSRGFVAREGSGSLAPRLAFDLTIWQPGAPTPPPWPSARPVPSVTPARGQVQIDFGSSIDVEDRVQNRGRQFQYGIVRLCAQVSWNRELPDSTLIRWQWYQKSGTRFEPIEASTLNGTIVVGEEQRVYSSRCIRAVDGDGSDVPVFRNEYKVDAFVNGAATPDSSGTAVISDNVPPGATAIPPSPSPRPTLAVSPTPRPVATSTPGDSVRCVQVIENGNFEQGPAVAWSLATNVQPPNNTTSRVIRKASDLQLMAAGGEWLANMGGQVNVQDQLVSAPFDFPEASQIVSATLDFSFGIITDETKDGSHDDTMVAALVSEGGGSVLTIPRSGISEEIIDSNSWYSLSQPLDVTELVTARPGWTGAQLLFESRNDAEASSYHILDEVRLSLCARGTWMERSSRARAMPVSSPKPIDWGASGMVQSQFIRRTRPMLQPSSQAEIGRPRPSGRVGPDVRP